MLKAPNYIHKRGERCAITDHRFSRCASQPVSQCVESAGMCMCAFARAGGRVCVCVCV